MLQTQFQVGQKVSWLFLNRMREILVRHAPRASNIQHLEEVQCVINICMQEVHQTLEADKALVINIERLEHLLRLHGEPHDALQRCGGRDIDSPCGSRRNAANRGKLTAVVELTTAVEVHPRSCAYVEDVKVSHEEWRTVRHDAVRGNRVLNRPSQRRQRRRRVKAQNHVVEERVMIHAPGHCAKESHPSGLPRT